jgi:hypothetical protein
MERQNDIVVHDDKAVLRLACVATAVIATVATHTPPVS